MGANLSERSLKQTLLLPNYLQVNYSGKFLKFTASDINLPYGLLVVLVTNATMKTGMNTKNLTCVNTRSGYIKICI